MNPERYDLICEYLASYYDVSPYQWHGVQHPVVNYPVSPEQAEDVDSISGHLTESTPDIDSMEFYNYAYLHSLQNSGRNLFNGTTFAFKRLRFNPLRIDATIGKYFDMIATCIALEVELLDVFERGMLRLPMRTQYHRTISPQEALKSGKGRSAAIGGVMLIVFNQGGEYKAIVSRRTGQHATRPNALHMIPAFIYQPMDDDNIRQAWSFKQHLYREYLEELLGMEEGDSTMQTHPALKDLQAMEVDGRATIRLTGVSINLLTLRAEISALLLIHDANWWDNLQSGNRGYKLSTPESHDNLLLIPIDSDEGILEHLPERYYLSMVPQAIPAFHEGIEIARHLISSHDK